MDKPTYDEMRSTLLRRLEAADKFDLANIVRVHDQLAAMMEAGEITDNDLPDAVLGTGWSDDLGT